MSENKDQISKGITAKPSQLTTNQDQVGKGKESKWLNNNDESVENIFGFNENSELVNGRAAMIGFIMLILTELVFHGAPVTHSIFAIN